MSRMGSGAASPGLENRDDRGADAPVVGGLALELLSPRRRQAILADGPPGFRDRRRRLDESLQEQLLQGRVQGSLFDAQFVVRDGLDALGDGVAMERPVGEDAEDQHDEGAGRKAVVPRHSLTMPIVARTPAAVKHGRALYFRR